jgi:hypothetical protein
MMDERVNNRLHKKRAIIMRHGDNNTCTEHLTFSLFYIFFFSDSNNHPKHPLGVLYFFLVVH